MRLLKLGDFKTGMFGDNYNMYIDYSTTKNSHLYFIALNLLSVSLQSEDKNHTVIWTGTESRLAAVRVGGGSWVREGEGIEQEGGKRIQTHGCGQQHGDCWGGWWGELEEGTGEVNGDGRRLDLGRWTHNMMYRWCSIELYT